MILAAVVIEYIEWSVLSSCSYRDKRGFNSFSCRWTSNFAVTICVPHPLHVLCTFVERRLNEPFCWGALLHWPTRMRLSAVTALSCPRSLGGGFEENVIPPTLPHMFMIILAIRVPRLSIWILGSIS